MSAASAQRSRHTPAQPAAASRAPVRIDDDDEAMLRIRSAVWSLFGIAELAREHGTAPLAIGQTAFLCVLSACVRDAGSNLEAALRDCGSPMPGRFPAPAGREVAAGSARSSETVGRLCAAVRHLAAVASLTDEEFASHSPAEFVDLARAALTEAGREAETALVELHGWRPGCFLAEVQPTGSLS